MRASVSEADFPRVAPLVCEGGEGEGGGGALRSNAAAHWPCFESRELERPDFCEGLVLPFIIFTVIMIIIIRKS